jgi:hypothetical protein
MVAFLVDDPHAANARSPRASRRVISTTAGFRELNSQTRSLGLAESMAVLVF